MYFKLPESSRIILDIPNAFINCLTKTQQCQRFQLYVFIYMTSLITIILMYSNNSVSEVIPILFFNFEKCTKSFDYNFVNIRLG